MKPFDPVAKCPKCGNDDIRATFRIKNEFGRCGESPTKHCPSTMPEHLHRECRRCHYEWVEAPLDTTKKRHSDTSSRNTSEP